MTAVMLACIKQWLRDRALTGFKLQPQLRLRIICSCLPTPTMSTIHLVCILDGHISQGRYSFTFPLDLSIGDLLDCVDNYHDQSACQCQNASTGVAWVANLTEYPYRKLQFDSSNIPSTMRRERADLIRSIVGVVKTSAAIHLVIEQAPRSGMSCSIPRVA